jgi:hypothetical protein
MPRILSDYLLFAISNGRPLQGNAARVLTTQLETICCFSTTAQTTYCVLVHIARNVAPSANYIRKTKREIATGLYLDGKGLQKARVRVQVP